jgi:hypothetical protein
MSEQLEALRLAELCEGSANAGSSEPWTRHQAAAELRRQHAEIERLGNLCYDYIGQLTALRAAKQMQQRIDELKGQREWQGLAEEEVMNFYMFWVVDLQDIIGFYKAIERKLKERNHA